MYQYVVSQSLVHSRLNSYLKCHKLFQSMSIEMLLKHFLSLFVGRKEFLYNKDKKVNRNSFVMFIPKENAFCILNSGDNSHTCITMLYQS